MSSTLVDLTEDDVLAFSERLEEPEWLRDRRLEAYKAFADLPWPTVRDEEWRYTDPGKFDLRRPVLEAAGQALPRRDGIVAALHDSVSGVAHVVDGRVVEAAPGLRASQQGVVVTDFASAAHEHPDLLAAHLGSVVGHATKFDALSLAAFTGGVLVFVPDDVEVAEPVAVTLHATADGAALPRVLVVTGVHARATVYVDHAGDAAQTVVETVEVVVGDGSQVRVVTAQDWGGQVDHVANHCGLVGANGDYRALEASLGGRTVYVRPDVRLDRPGGSGELFGVYFCDSGQHVEHRSLIHHNASQTSSELVYKGALQGDSSATFFGNIRIEPYAKATSSDQTNRNLILTEGAKADSIPFLEIHNSDVVRCGHHSSVGQVDELQLFYLESRGIPREEAARLLVFGFLAEVLERIDAPGVTETVLAEIESEIRSGPTAEMDPRRA